MIRESELFNRSLFVLKIKGYTFHNYYIPRKVCTNLGDVTKSVPIILDEDCLRSYRKEYSEDTKNADEVTFVHIDGSEVAVVRHESGIEVFILAVASGITASIVYDIIKKIVTSFIRSIKEENERYPTEHDFDTADILLIKRKYSIKLGQIHKRNPVEFETYYAVDEQLSVKLLKSLIENDNLETIDKDVIEIIRSQNLVYKEEKK